MQGWKIEGASETDAFGTDCQRSLSADSRTGSRTVFSSGKLAAVAHINHVGDGLPKSDHSTSSSMVVLHLRWTLKITDEWTAFVSFF